MTSHLCRFRPDRDPRGRSPLGRARGPVVLAGWLAAAVTVAAVGTPAAAPTVLERTLAERLARAAHAGNHSQIAYLGARAGARGLGPILLAGSRAGAGEPAGAPGDRAAHLAAALAAPAAEDAWALLAPLAVHAAGPDRVLAVAAAASAADIGARLHRAWRSVYEAQDIDPASLAAARERWRELAADHGRWIDVRVLSLETSVHIGRVLRAATWSALAGPAPGAAELDAELAAAARDPEPALRRAAFELMALPLADELGALAGAAVRGDADARVALAAAQALCGGIRMGADPASALAALDVPGRARLSVLLARPALPPAARIDAARCLAAAGDPDSRRAISALRASLPADLRGLVSPASP